MPKLLAQRCTDVHKPDPRTLRIAYTPDSDDVFNFYGWEHGPIKLAGYAVEFEPAHLLELNRAAVGGEHDVTNISSAIYPAIADQYAILATGTSVGRNYGPVLVSRNYRSIAELRNKTIAVGGATTTGAALARMYCPNANLVEHRYDEIADAVLADRFDAGVMIHEELLFFPQRHLHRVCDLGAAWFRQTGLPLPVGLNIAHRRLGPAMLTEVARTCRDSLRWSLDHFDEAFTFASRFGRGCTRQFIEMFCNDDTLHMPPDVRRALRVWFDRLESIGLTPRLEQIEVIDA